MEQGEPRGELIQVQLALEDPKLKAPERKKFQAREKELLEKHRAEWVGDWADKVSSHGPEGRGQLDLPGPKPFRFVRGVLTEVTIDALTLACARAINAAPQLRLVRKLAVGGFAYEEPGTYDEGDDTAGAEDNYEPSGALFPKWPYFANLRSFQFGWTSDEEYGDFCHFQCHLDGNKIVNLVQKMTLLEELYLFAHAVDCKKLFGLRLPNLRVLQVYHSHDAPLEKLAANPTMTNLTHLLIHPHALEPGDEPYIDLKDLKALVKSPHLPSLAHLRLRLAGFGDKGVEEIVQSGVLQRLKTLDLRHGRVSDEGAKLLAGCPDARGLELLDLSRNELTAEGIKALRALGLPAVRTEHQHESTADLGPEELAESEVFMEADYE
jgi:hypothetical protein